jgi:hypothetical protein
VIARWPTGRCVEDDLPGLRQTRDSLRGFLQQQQPAWSGTEPFAGGTRPNTFTFHNGDGRGAVWRDDRRGMLWLCSASDHHDAGYEHAHALVEDGQLYPQLDGAYLDGHSATVPWGECPDDDRLEALRFTGSAAQTFGGLTGPNQATATFDNGIGWIRLSAQDEIWRMTIRRNLVYVDEACERDRWLSTAELERVFVELTGQDVEEADLWAPPHDQFHINIDFIGGPLRPQDWLAQRIAALLAGKPHHALRAS